MPVYNAASTVFRAIDSVLKQTYTNFTLYVINDCSADNSYELISERYHNEPRLKLLSNSNNLGAAKTRNVALQFCQYSYVFFIDSDDEWNAEKIAVQMSYMISSDVKLCATSYNYVNNNGSFIINYNQTLLTQEDFLKKKTRVCLSTVGFFNKEFYFSDIGHEDFLFLNSLFSEYGTCFYVNKVLASYYVLQDSLSSDKIKSACWHFKIIAKLFGWNVPKVIYYMYFYVFNAFKIRLGK